MVIFIDLDGVMTDFVQGFHKALGLEYNPENYPYTLGKYDIFDQIANVHNIDHAIFERILNDQDFWKGLPKTKEADEILSICEKFSQNIVFFTNISYNMENAIIGKYLWIKNNYPKYINNILIGSVNKNILSFPGSILLDDCDENINNFNALYGIGILIPRKWNSGYQKEKFLTQILYNNLRTLTYYF